MYKEKPHSEKWTIHQKHSLDNTSLKWFCTLCSVMCTEVHEITSHLKLHFDSDFYCTLCHRTYPIENFGRTSRLYPIASAWSEASDMQCRVCKTYYNNLEMWHQHIFDHLFSTLNVCLECINIKKQNIQLNLSIESFNNIDDYVLNILKSDTRVCILASLLGLGVRPYQSNPEMQSLNYSHPEQSKSFIHKNVLPHSVTQTSAQQYSIPHQFPHQINPGFSVTNHAENSLMVKNDYNLLKKRLSSPALNSCSSDSGKVNSFNVYSEQICNKNNNSLPLEKFKISLNSLDNLKKIVKILYLDPANKQLISARNLTESDSDYSNKSFTPNQSSEKWPVIQSVCGNFNQFDDLPGNIDSSKSLVPKKLVNTNNQPLDSKSVYLGNSCIQRGSYQEKKLFQKPSVNLLSNATFNVDNTNNSAKSFETGPRTINYVNDSSRFNTSPSNQRFLYSYEQNNSTNSSLITQVSPNSGHQNLVLKLADKNIDNNQYKSIVNNSNGIVLSGMYSKDLNIENTVCKAGNSMERGFFNQPVSGFVEQSLPGNRISDMPLSSVPLSFESKVDKQLDTKYNGTNLGFGRDVQSLSQNTNLSSQTAEPSICKELVKFSSLEVQVYSKTPSNFNENFSHTANKTEVLSPPIIKQDHMFIAKQSISATLPSPPINNQNHSLIAKQSVDPKLSLTNKLIATNEKELVKSPSTFYENLKTSSPENSLKLPNFHIKEQKFNCSSAFSAENLAICKSIEKHKSGFTTESKVLNQNMCLKNSVIDVMNIAEKNETVVEQSMNEHVKEIYPKIITSENKVGIKTPNITAAPKSFKNDLIKNKSKSQENLTDINKASVHPSDKVLSEKSSDTSFVGHCGICDSIFNTLSELYTHQVIEHISIIYQCKSCKKYLTLPCYLFLDKSVKYCGYVCGGCSNSFKLPEWNRTENLQCHMCFELMGENYISHYEQHFDNADGVYVCLKCRQSFHEVAMLRSHSEIHLFRCKYCFVLFKTFHLHKKHLIAHKEKICEKINVPEQNNERCLEEKSKRTLKDNESTKYIKSKKIKHL